MPQLSCLYEMILMLLGALKELIFLPQDGIVVGSHDAWRVDEVGPL